MTDRAGTMLEPSDAAMRAAVDLEIQMACQTITTRGLARHLDKIASALRAHQPKTADREEISVSYYVENYRFEFENGRQYTPNDQDKALLEDAILGWDALSQPPASGEMIQSTTAQAEAPIGHAISGDRCETILQDLYDSEINFSIITFWDNGFEVKLGDEMNGFVAAGNAKQFSNAVEWLMIRAIEKYPDSVFTKTYRKASEVSDDR